MRVPQPYDPERGRARIDALCDRHFLRLHPHVRSGPCARRRATLLGRRVLAEARLLLAAHRAWVTGRQA